MVGVLDRGFGKQPVGVLSRVDEVVSTRPPIGVEQQETQLMGRPRKIAYVVVLGLLAVSSLGVLLVHLHFTGKSSTTKMAVTTTASARRTTTTTLALPTALQTSAEAAAAGLVSSWSTGNKPAASTVATPGAVATLFAAPYSSGLAVDRGCSTSFTPIVCTFGPPGGASPNDPIYQVLVSQAPGGWYVSSVRIEN